MKSRTIKVKYLARVEGEGGLHLRIKDGRVADVKLKIFEPPRFFEAFLRGRQYYEAPDITSRICGICPVAYLMSSVHAMEDALGVKVAGPLRELRRLLYCGEWIESHALHVFMLHAPDFLGYQDAIQMAQDHPDVVKMGLRLKKIGNEVVTTGGGPGDPSHQRPGGRLLPGAHPSGAGAPGRGTQVGPGGGLKDGALGGGPAHAGVRRRTTSSSPCAMRRNIPSTKGGWFPIRGWTSRSKTTTATLPKSTWLIPMPCNRT